MTAARREVGIWSEYGVSAVRSMRGARLICCLIQLQDRIVLMAKVVATVT